MTRKGLTQGAGGKEPSCRKIKQVVGKCSLKGKKASRQARRGGYEPGGGGCQGHPGAGGAGRLLP